MDPLYTVERTYPQSVDAVWRAWTDADELEQWYAPVELSVVPGSVVSDARVGGEWAVGVDVPMHGFVAWFFGRYTEVDEFRHLAHTLHYTQDEDDFRARREEHDPHTVTIDLAETPEGTWVRWQQFGFLPEEQVPATKAGMESYFESLARHLDR
jgi:uncharacterized protein YndB with AHSA1/START domain